MRKLSLPLLSVLLAGLFTAGGAEAALTSIVVDAWRNYDDPECRVCGRAFSWCAEPLEVGRFADPTPEGATVTNISVTIWGTACDVGSQIRIEVDDTAVQTRVDDMPLGCECDACDSSTPYVSADYPDGFPGWVDGGDNTVEIVPVGACSALYPSHVVVDITYQDSVCGDGIIEGSEECEDLNLVDEDSCTNLCRNARCGDGSLWNLDGGSEECDDGNAIDTDACPTTCENARCGDSFVRAGVEECDDGNDVDTDACVSGCVLATCGDLFVQEGVEECDDGNDIQEDACLDTCLLNVCGDGFTRSRGLFEECDDGNLDDGDGCSATCTVEHGYECTDGVCTSTCGDGLVASDEGCDDGGVEAGDGCDAECDVEPGWVCAGEPSVCRLSCGDGIVQELEGCDDANDTDGDGCTDCQPDEGFACEGEPSVCESTCGDGVLASDEECDDGNLADGDGCSSLCEPDGGGDSDGDTDGDTDSDADGGEDGATTGGCGCRTAGAGDGWLAALAGLVLLARRRRPA